MVRERTELNTPEVWWKKKEFEDLCWEVPYYRTEVFRAAVAWEAKKILGRAPCNEAPAELSQPSEAPQPRRPVPVRPGDALPRPEPPHAHYLALSGPQPTPLSPTEPPAVSSLKEPKEASISWFPRTGSTPCEQEMLFFALLVINNATDTAELKAWAADVTRRESSFLSRGVKALPDDFTVGHTPAAYAPLAAAYTGVWTATALGQIGKAMQMWSAAGRLDGLNAGRLKTHKQNHKKAVWQSGGGVRRRRYSRQRDWLTRTCRSCTACWASRMRWPTSPPLQTALLLPTLHATRR